MSDRVVVVGGGLAGLSCAHRLLELEPELDVTVLEAADRAGGLIGTVHTDDGYVIEVGPDSIITDKPAALKLVDRLGLSDALVGTVPENRGAYVVAHGRLERVPEGFALLGPARVGPFLRTPILSWRGKARAALDLVLPRGAESDDESLAHFVRRRFGDEVFDRLAQPLAGGIYGADPERLSLRATMPRFLEMEERSRSVSMGLLKRSRAAGQAASGARYGLFVAFREGNGSLVEALVSAVGGERVETGRPVTQIARDGERFTVHTAEGSIDADAVVVALPAWRAADLLVGVASDLVPLLSGIPYGSAATVTLAWPSDAIAHPMDAYGFVVPTVERRDILASTWFSRKWPDRSPEGMDLLRVFVGGPGRDALVERPDDELLGLARRELDDLIGLRGEPVLTRVDKHLRAMPHYHVGHLARVTDIESRVGAIPGLELAGNAYRGVGIPDTIKSGEAAAGRIVRHLL